MEHYIVGGAVRDQLLGRDVVDHDWVVVGATPEQMLQRGFRQVGADFPVFLHPETGEEYALARTERKQGRGYHGFTVHAAPDVTLEDDLARRDLTINAMAEAASGELVDPFGGRADLEARRLRHVGPAFVEDPLRVLRVARFAAQLADYDFEVAEETKALMREMSASGELADLTPERVWAETVKALATARPSRYFAVLHEVGALRDTFPEVEALFGVPQPEEYHPEVDTGIHTLLVLDAASGLSDDIAVRFAAVCHDLGKALTPREEWPRHIGHERRGIDPTRALCERLRTPKAVRELAITVTAQHGRIHRALEMRDATLVDLLGELDALRRPDRFEAILTVCHADSRGKPGKESVDYPEGEWLRRVQATVAAISPQPLLEQGIKGKALGEALRRERIRAVGELRREGIADASD
ncbi:MULTISPECIES: multifunctional CCA addition/repair protein [unclassified Guyparkeria]|uniref:multifunctional CCA addition/repair protein n=1 Tax=unclassified Guyparkeria TaxID=2626246 RepID=UPI0007334C07|nr:MULTISPECIES: multifunctional CCA addition/repair protein [unclassified Guyparkeria]KTG17961.1 2', 3'-cyclic nucleotide 2'-phosphodiesterase [Guyparkeria sp. XI15]OAE89670.1 multifunctional CCA tRNA nucleotidyl transferase/2'3'-cyclic phosphodiesterase/2'nucleotidase/phosphatase [Guyparkeria sp. WRN-7]